MARIESDREDLLREATAFVERAELKVQGVAESVVVGFRTNGAASVFFGAAPVYQFNTDFQFRRGYLDDRLIKAEKGKLVSLTRQRGDGEVQLIRHEFTPKETEAFFKDAGERLAFLHSQLVAGSYEVVGQVPADGKAVRRAIDFLAILGLGRSMSIAASPRVG